MSILDEMIEDEYTICPISTPEYQHCDNDCDNCSTYKEFMESFKEE